jgi:hypothetical protein
MKMAAAEKKPTEPKQRKDGTCYVCRKELPVIALRMGDPFCSSSCCRSYYEVV